MSDTAVAHMEDDALPPREVEEEEEEEEETASAPAAAMDEEQEDDEGASVAASSSNKMPEFEPPLSSVTKVIRRAVGESVQVGKEAKATFTRAAGIFILYVTACANDFSREGKRATITANDIYLALRELDFEEFIEPLKGFLKKEQEQKKAKAESKAADKAARKEGEGEGEESGAEKDRDEEASMQEDDDQEEDDHAAEMEQAKEEEEQGEGNGAKTGNLGGATPAAEEVN